MEQEKTQYCARGQRSLVRPAEQEMTPESAVLVKRISPFRPLLKLTSNTSSNGEFTKHRERAILKHVLYTHFSGHATDKTYKVGKDKTVTQGF